MDPTTTLNLLYDAVEDQDTKAAHQAATDLLGWLNRGGFAPKGLTIQQTRHLCWVVRDAAETGQTLTI